MCYFGPSSGCLEFQPTQGPDVAPASGANTGIGLSVNIANISRLYPADSLHQSSRSSTSRPHFRQIAQTSTSSDEITEELESHLIELYFTCDQPWYQVVNEKLFRESRAAKGRYFSPLLLNCILCVGARYSHRSQRFQHRRETIPRPCGGFASI